MALIISSGVAGATGNATATGVSQVIVSGEMKNNYVSINVSADGGADAPAYSFRTAGAISLQTSAGTSIDAKIEGTSADSTIDVSVL
jgi:hypothetical protein